MASLLLYLSCNQGQSLHFPTLPLSGYSTYTQCYFPHFYSHWSFPLLYSGNSQLFFSVLLFSFSFHFLKITICLITSKLDENQPLLLENYKYHLHCFYTSVEPKYSHLGIYKCLLAFSICICAFLMLKTSVRYYYFLLLTELYKPFSSLISGSMSEWSYLRSILSFLNDIVPISHYH